MSQIELFKPVCKQMTDVKLNGYYYIVILEIIQLRVNKTIAVR